MRLVSRMLRFADHVRAPKIVRAHCDIPCGVYDPEQARIEAESCHKMVQKYLDNDDPVFRARVIGVKEERADICKHHLYVLWSDYFKPPALEQFPNLHDVFWRAAKQASEVKHTVDLGETQKLLDLIDEIDEMFRKTNGIESSRVAGRPAA